MKGRSEICTLQRLRPKFVSRYSQLGSMGTVNAQFQRLNNAKTYRNVIYGSFRDKYTVDVLTLTCRTKGHRYRGHKTETLHSM